MKTKKKAHKFSHLRVSALEFERWHWRQ